MLAGEGSDRRVRSRRRGRLLALPVVALLALLSALAWAAPAAASDVYVTNQFSSNVSQYDVGAGGALVAKATPTVPAGDGPFGVAVRPTPPPPATITNLIGSVEELDLPRGLENSLLTKLSGAQKNLDTGDTAGACDKLASFISQVQALKGKKITPASAADDLIAEADAVQESVGCT